MLKEYSLEGKVVIITGASRGLGRSIAVTFAEAGADITAAARSVRDLEETAAQVHQLRQHCLVIPTDVTRETHVRNLVQRTLAEFGKIDVLVNNAGMEIMKPILPLSELKVPSAQGIEADPITLQEWYKVMDLNLTSVFLCCREVGKHMAERRQGRIINITSEQAVKAGPYMIPYSVSKAAVAMFTRCLALEWARYNIKVNALAPGPLESELMRRLTGGDEKVLARYLKDTPLRRLGQTREVALLAVYLASSASDYMTGQQVILDGGGSAS